MGRTRTIVAALGTAVVVVADTADMQGECREAGQRTGTLQPALGTQVEGRTQEVTWGTPVPAQPVPSSVA
jgi:hypothetical protein